MNKYIAGFIEIKSMPKIHKFILLVFVIAQLVLISYSRPVQDDYGYLAGLSKDGLLNQINYFWENWGGNITLVVITSLFIKIALLTSISVAYISLGVISTLLLCLAFYSGFSLFCTKMRQRDRIFSSIFLSQAGYASLAFPAHIASLSFTTAIIAHLWPICIFLIVLWILSVRNVSFILLFFVGFLTSNTNIAEGAAMFLFSLGVLLARKSFLTSALTPRIAPLVIGQFFGLLLIVLAPGFSARADVVGTQSKVGLQGLKSFLAALIDFTGSIVATPAFICLIILLALNYLKILRCFSEFLLTLKKSIVLSFLMVLVYIMVIGGATFAYAAWHQSLGLIFLSTLNIYIIFFNIYYVNDFSFPKIVRNSFVFFLVAIFCFDAYSGITRGRQWDSALEANLCSVENSQGAELLGAELLNPITRLGIEDVKSWEWIRTDYISWLMTLDTSPSCP
jgi:hypothetical protein